jgi:hypothetical protein
MEEDVEGLDMVEDEEYQNHEWWGFREYEVHLRNCILEHVDSVVGMYGTWCGEGGEIDI